jgi:hypothetical protein
MSDEAPRKVPVLVRWIGRAVFLALGAAGAGLAWKGTERVRRRRAEQGPGKRRWWRKKMKGVLLVTHNPIDVEALAQKIDEPEIAFYSATSEAVVRAVLKSERVDFVCIGGGLSDEERCRMCTTVMSIRDDIHIHLKDRASGPAGMATFVKAVINGFR